MNHFSKDCQVWLFVLHLSTHLVLIQFANDFEVVAFEQYDAAHETPGLDLTRQSLSALQ